MPVLSMAVMVTAPEESGRCYTHQTENVCADPPSKPASQDTLACFTPGETDMEEAAWGLVPVMEEVERSWWKVASISTTWNRTSLEASSWCTAFIHRRRRGGLRWAEQVHRIIIIIIWEPEVQTKNEESSCNPCPSVVLWHNTYRGQRPESRLSLWPRGWKCYTPIPHGAPW